MLKCIVYFLGLVLCCLPLQAKPKMVVVLAEQEYYTEETLPHFMNQTCADYFDIDYVIYDQENRHSLKGLDKVVEADLLVLSTWRLALPKQDLQIIRDYMKTVKPVYVLRTSTHGFSLRPTQEVPKGSDQWPEFDREILGCYYNGHDSSAYMTDVHLGEKKHPIIKKINPFSVRSWLYRVSPIEKDCEVLLWGSVRGGDKEPLAWTRIRESGGKVFCTTMGHHEDFLSKEFQTILYRSLHWCIDRDVSDEKFECRFFNDYLEEKITCVGATFDARKKNDGLHPKNISSRTLWIRAGHEHHIAFDTDLLRPAYIWKGEGLTQIGMAHGSYNLETWSKKAKFGESHLPSPIGEVMMSMPLVAGVDSGASRWQDPREKLKDENQLSHGPLPVKLGKYKGLYRTDKGSVLSYEIKGVSVLEQYKSKVHNGMEILERSMALKKVEEQLVFHLGQRPYKKMKTTPRKVTYELQDGDYFSVLLSDNQGVQFVEHEKGLDVQLNSKGNVEFSIYYIFHNEGISDLNIANSSIDLTPSRKLWKEEIEVKSRRESEDTSAFVQEEIPLPYMNEDRRNIRAADVAFFKDGSGAVVTFDGDVWLFRESKPKVFVWKRYAAGLHEPQGIAIRDEQVFVFDRQGLVRLHDLNKDGEADYHENYCDLMIQTSETREFSMGLELLSDGSFVVAKGGQRTHTLNPHAGAIIKISADGKKVQKLAGGFREPYIGIDAKTDAVFASDQQGHWIPTTPFHDVQENGHYGFIPPLVKTEEPDYVRPNLYIPHPVLQSGAGIIKVHSKAMKSFNERILYLGYCKPVMGVIDYHSKQKNQSAFYTVDESFDFPLLKAAQNPKDGLIYLTGFQIWGSKAKKLSGLCRIKPSKKHAFPLGSSVYKEGIRIDFPEKIQSESVLPVAFKLERWNYLRSPKYGSGYYNLKGDPGKEPVLFSSLTLSHDRKSVFIAVPQMEESMQLGVSYSLVSEKGHALKGEIYTTPKALGDQVFKSKDFPKIDFKALAIKFESSEPKEASVQFGKSVIERVGCMGCHSTTEKRDGRNGPPWKGLFASKRKIKGGSKLVADENYLKESILSPMAKVSEGYEPTMPPYAGLLSEVELDSIILFLKSIK